MVPQSGELLPGLAAVGRPEQGGIFHSGVDRIRIGERRFQVPDPFKLPGMRSSVVPLMSARDAIVRELVVHWFPGLAAIVRALDHLPEPSAALRRINTIRVRGRTLHVINLPT